MLFTVGTYAVATWNFDTTVTGASIAAVANTSPAPSFADSSALGSDTSSSIGMTLYANSGLTAQDQSAITKGVVNNGWQINGNNGWNTGAPVGSQGAQFNVDTTNYNALGITFDWIPSKQGEGKLAVQYSTNGTSWSTVPAASLSIGSNTGITIGNNLNSTGGTIDTSIAPGGYFKSTATGTFTTLSVDLSSVTGITDTTGFEFRLVNAATGVTDDTNASGTALNNTSGNWIFDDVKIVGNPIRPIAPTFTTNPASVTANGGTSVSFSATGTGVPAPAEQWQYSTDGVHYSNVTNGSGGTTSTYNISAGANLNGDYFRAVLNNGTGGDSSNNVYSAAAQLTVPTTATVTTQPTAQTDYVVNPVTFTAAGFGPGATTVQWKVSTNNGNNFNNVAFSTGSASYNNTTGVATYTYTPAEEDSGDQFEAVFTSGGTTATSSAATLTVIGTPITDWTFPSQQTAPIEAPQPTPTIGTGSALPIGMGEQGSSDYNNYTGVQSFAADDITGTTGVADTNFTENLWRIRGGSGQGATGSPGTPEGWSSSAPELQAVTLGGNTFQPQGAEWLASTVGYNNVVVHLDWYSTGSGVRDAQPQYTTDGGATWINYTPSGPGNSGTTAQYILVAGQGDYYSTSTQNSTTAPTGVTLNFQGSAFSAVNNNANFGVRLVAAYDPALPLINDGNALVPAYHGQYATATPGGANTSQELVVSNASGGSFTLTIGSVTTQPISYDSGYSFVGGVYTSNLATDIANALNANLGSGAVTVTTMDATATNFTVTFANAQTSTLGANVSQLTGSSPSVTNIYSGAIVPYTIAGSGNWRFGNVDIAGDNSVGAPGILSEPSSQTATLASSGIGATAPGAFTSSVYSETATTVQWQSSTGSTWTNVSGATSITQSGNLWSSSYTAAPTSTSQSGTLYRAVFTNATNLTATSNTAVLTVVVPITPAVTAQPVSVSAIAGNSASFTASATGLPNSFNSTGGSTTWYFSSNGGTTWSQVVTGSGTTVSTTASLITSGVTQGDQLTTSTLTLPAVLTHNYEYEAKFVNSIGYANSSAATLTVLPVYTPVTQWTFATTGYNNSPTPSTDSASGTLSAIGFNDNNFQTIYGGQPSVNADDVTNTAGTANTAFNENTWRIRGGATATAGGAPDNGWDSYAPEYSQGLEADFNTTGYVNLYVTFDWYTTAQGVRDLQEQYNTNINNPNGWTNINAPLTAPGGDFYGASSNGAPTGALIDLTGISGAANDANFGIRLVSAYDPGLPTVTDTQTIQGENSYTLPEPHGQYASATLVNGSPTTLNGSSGNWRFGPITLYGAAVPAWLDPNSVLNGDASWNTTSHVLTVTGPTNIIGDPGTDEPIITASGSLAQVSINPGTSTQTVNVGGLVLSGGAGVKLTSTTTSDILIVAAGGPVSITASSKLDLGKGFADFQASNLSQGQSTLSSITGMLATGYAGGTWSGNGITSSVANADGSHLTTLGAMLNNSVYGVSGSGLGAFDNYVPNANDVLVRYTYYGDANLSGFVDGSDYSVIDSSYASEGFVNGTPARHVSGWYNGDFNFDGVVDGSDYTLMDNGFNSENAHLSAQIATPTAQIAAIATTAKLQKKTSVFAGSLLEDASSGAVGTILTLAKHDKENSLVSLLDSLNK